MLYFAFASNLDPGRMRAVAPSHRVVGLASLADHRLAFPRFSPEWSGGLGAPQLAHSQTLWGMVYDVTDEDLKALDEQEGFRGPGDQHNICDREITTVDLVRPDDGSIPRRIRPWIYLTRPSNPTAPSRRYLDFIIAGARHHKLPEDYVRKLVTIEAVEAPATE
jgi:gamma-glutamylcyclotransferase